MTDNPIIRVIAPCHLLQSIRASHAISETGYTLSIEKADEPRFAALVDAFPETLSLSFASGHDVPIEIDHETPRTSVGSVSRPLIFPVAMVDRCRALWSRERDVYCQFRGLVTRQRKCVLNRARSLLDERSHKNVLLPTRSTTKVVFVASSKGRSFPVKSWDEAFYAELGHTRFALCPNGDYIWTYRFFEAALCGAIPVVEQAADCYQGFRYHTLDELSLDLEWSEDDALHNHALCRSLVTVLPETLRSAVADLAHSNGLTGFGSR